jgi:hypothetical protein
LLFDISSIVFCVFDESLSAFVRTTYRFWHDKKKVFFSLFFSFLFLKKSVVLDQRSLFEI